MYNTFIRGSVTQCIIHSLEVVCYSMYNTFIRGSLLLNV